MSDSITENIITALLFKKKKKNKNKKHKNSLSSKKKKQKKKGLILRNKGSNSMYVLRAVYKFH
jgi:hypothetical protein